MHFDINKHIGKPLSKLKSWPMKFIIRNFYAKIHSIANNIPMLKINHFNWLDKKLLRLKLNFSQETNNFTLSFEQASQT